MKFRGLSATLAFCFLALSCSGRKESLYEEHLSRLDATLEMADEYIRAKEQKISTIENMLHSRGVTPMQQYHIYGQLYEEFFAFQFDKAKDAIEHQITLADEIGERSLKDDAMLDKALLLPDSFWKRARSSMSLTPWPWIRDRWFPGTMQGRSFSMIIRNMCGRLNSSCRMRTR